MKDNELDEFGFEPIDQEPDQQDDLSEFGFEMESEDTETSQLEAAALGTGQGVTAGFLDELYGILTAKGGAGRLESISKPIKEVAAKEKAMMDSYSEQRDKLRERIDTARKEHPTTSTVSEVLGGIIPAAMSGGASIPAQVSKGLATKSAPLLKPLAKSAVEGIKYGGAYGLGESKGEDLEEMAKDTGKGALTGAIAGPVASLGIKGLGKAYTGTSKGVKSLMDRFETLSVPFKHASQHGLTTKQDRSKLLEKQTKDLLKNIKSTFKELKLSDDVVSEAETKVDLTKGISLIAKDLREKAGMFSGKESKRLNSLAKEADILAKGSVEAAKEDLEKQVQKEIQKKLDASGRKEAKAIADTESKLAQHAVKTNDELKMIAESKVKGGDLELPLDTQNLEIQKGRGRFVTEGEEYDKIFTKDVTKFQPSPIEISEEGGQIVAKYVDQATGEEFFKRIDAPPGGLDFANMSMDKLLNWVKTIGDKAWDKNHPEKELYQELWKLGRNKISELRPKLSKNKQEQSKLFEVMDILGIDKSNLNKPPSGKEMVKMIKDLPRKMDVEKDYIERNLIEEGSNISKPMQDIDLTSKMNRVMEGSTGQAGEFTKAGWAQKSAGTISEVLGTGYGKLSRAYQSTLGKPVKAATEMSNKLVKKLSPEQLGKFRDSMVNEGKGGQMIANRIDDLINAPDANAADAIIWSLSGNPAFRKILGKYIKSMGLDMQATTGIDPSPLDNLLVRYKESKGLPVIPPSDENVNRMPASIEEEDELSSVFDSESALKDSLAESEATRSQMDNAFDSEKALNDILPGTEEESNAGRSPASLLVNNELETPRDTYEYLKSKEGNAYSPSIKGEVEPETVEGNPNLIKLTGTPNRRIKGTGEAGYYYDAAGKLTRGYGELVTKEPTLEKVLNYTVEDAESDLDREIQEHKLDIENAIGVPLDVFLTDEQQKGIISYYYNVGVNPEHNSIKKLKEAANAPDIFTRNELLKESIKEMDINKAGGKFLQGLENRRIEERGFAKPNEDYFNMSNPEPQQPMLMEDGGVALKEVEKNISREKKQLGSGAIAGTERSTLDDLLGSLRKLQGVSEEDMGQMEESAYSGDMNRLQELLDKLKAV